MTPMDTMLRDIAGETTLTREYLRKDHLDAAVMAALAAVPRDAFVPAALARHAFENRPLPIGHGQTISQPYIVALMTDLLETRPEHTLLEIGTGSGYQTAVLARLVSRVYSLEIVPELAAQAAKRLDALGCRNVEVHLADGYAGLPEHAPYDGIIVTAAAPHLPPALVDQLKPGANLVIPVGRQGWSQDLRVVRRRPDGTLDTRRVLDVAFVPLTGAHGARDQ